MIGRSIAEIEQIINFAVGIAAAKAGRLNRPRPRESKPPPGMGSVVQVGKGQCHVSGGNGFLATTLPAL